MSTILPAARPVVTAAQLRDLVPELARGAYHGAPALVGIRGFMPMGQPGNDRGVYDDAIILTCGGCWYIHAFNANTDPRQLGLNPTIDKPYAQLMPGRYTFAPGLHPLRDGTPALRQHGPVKVLRDLGDGHPVTEEEGYFGINIHRGGRWTVGSDGCQTIHPDQWGEFLSWTYLRLLVANVKTLSYFLLHPTTA